MTGPDEVDARPDVPRPDAAPPSPASTAAHNALDTAPRPARSANPVEGDWPAVAADRIVDVVDTVRDKTSGPAQSVARAVVYGLLVAATGIVVFVLVIIAAIRLLNVVVDHFWPWGHAWLPYLILGVIFLVAGVLVFRRRRPRATTAP